MMLELVVLVHVLIVAASFCVAYDCDCCQASTEHVCELNGLLLEPLTCTSSSMDYLDYGLCGSWLLDVAMWQQSSSRRRHAASAHPAVKGTM